MNKKESIYVQLAKDSITYYLKNGRIMKQPAGLPEEIIKKKAGAFVSLKKNGQLRGCIGTFASVQKNLAEEIIENAVSAAFYDPRFSPVQLDEIEILNISVDVLSPAEEINDISLLDPKKYGVIVTNGSKKGLLLPDLEGVDSVEHQLAIAKQKAGILPMENFKIFRFTVTRHI